MSKPFPVVSGACLHVVRRTNHRLYKLTPTFESETGSGAHSDDDVKQIYEYVTGVVSLRTGVRVVAWCVMSNHVHELLFDAEGRLPEFLQDRNLYLAKAINAHFGLSGSVFDRGGPGKQFQEDANAMANTIVYILANPVEAGLVRKPHLWPGAISSMEELAPHTKKVKRPEAYFRGAKWPDEVEYTVGAPEEISGRFGGIAEMQRIVGARLEAALAKAERHHGGMVLGLKKIAQQGPETRAKAWEEFGDRVRKFAASTQDGERAAVARWKQFQLAYQDARERMLRGERVIWPEGTWKMHVDFGVERRGMALRRGSVRLR
jgi:REP element-mobilizing transposase RayT